MTIGIALLEIILGGRFVTGISCLLLNGFAKTWLEIITRPITTIPAVLNIFIFLPFLEAQLTKDIKNVA